MIIIHDEKEYDLEKIDFTEATMLLRESMAALLARNEYCIECANALVKCNDGKQELVNFRDNLVEQRRNITNANFTLTRVMMELCNALDAVHDDNELDDRTLN